MVDCFIPDDYLRMVWVLWFDHPKMSLGLINVVTQASRRSLPDVKDVLQRPHPP